MGKCAKGELEQEGYYSLVTFREVFFVNVVHRKPENCGAKSCECMISVHRGAVTGHGVNSNKPYSILGVDLNLSL